MKYAIYDTAGLFIEAVNIERVTVLPAHSVALTDAQFNDWQNYKREGGQVVYSPQPPEAPVIPQSVTPLQARKALRDQGLLATVNTMIAGSDEETQEAWEYATAIERQSSLVVTLAAGLGLTDAQLDGLFTLAASFA